ncbi:DUF6923 family protein [Corynebacterium sp. ZY180755]
MTIANAIKVLPRLILSLFLLGAIIVYSAPTQAAERDLALAGSNTVSLVDEGDNNGSYTVTVAEQASLKKVEVAGVIGVELATSEDSISFIKINGVSRGRTGDVDPATGEIPIAVTLSGGTLAYDLSSPLDVNPGDQITVQAAFSSVPQLQEGTVYMVGEVADPAEEVGEEEVAVETDKPQTETESEAESEAESETEPISEAEETLEEGRASRAFAARAAEDFARPSLNLAEHENTYNIWCANGDPNIGREWVSSNNSKFPDGTYYMTACGERDGISKVRVSYDFSYDGILTPYNQQFALAWQSQAQNGYDVDGGKEVTMTIVDPDGNTLARTSSTPDRRNVYPINAVDLNNTNNWGGVGIVNGAISRGLTIPAGSKIVIELSMRNNFSDTRHWTTGYFPEGPGALLYNFKRTVPKVCTDVSPLNIYGLNGEVQAYDDLSIPRVGRDWPTGKQAPRELTDEEKARGTSVYVTASTPQGQERNQSQLYIQPYLAEDFVPVGESTGWIVNALAYNPNDNWLYAISQGRDGVDDQRAEVSTAINTGQALFYEDPCYPAGHLLQIHPVTGEVYDLGKVTKASGSTANNTEGYGFQGEYGAQWSNDLWGGINVGFFDSEGNYWVTNSSLSGTGALYKVDINNVSAWTGHSFNAQQDSSLNRLSSAQNNGYVALSEDYALLSRCDYPLGGANGSDDSCPGGVVGDESVEKYAWGIVNTWLSDPPAGEYASNKVFLERINLETGQVTRFDITSLENSLGQRIPTGHQWSKAWTYGDGTLGFGTGSSGQSSDVINIRITNPHANNARELGAELQTVSQTAPPAYNTNGTSNGYLKPFEADLAVEKAWLKNENGRIYWQIDAWNNGPDGTAGLVLRDELDATKFNDFKVESVVKPDGLLAEVSPAVGRLTSIRDQNVMEARFGELAARASGSNEPQVTVVISAGIKPEIEDQCISNKIVISGSEYDPEIDNNTSVASCDIAIEKTVVDTNEDGEIDSIDVEGPREDGTYLVSYDVKVMNDGEERAAYRKVIDTPEFNEAFSVKSLSVTKPGAEEPTVVERSGNNEYVINDETRTLEAGASETYRVDVVFTPDTEALAGNPDALTCEGEGNGLLNRASVNGRSDTDCVDFPGPKNITLNISKVDFEDRNLELPGASFEIYKADDNDVVKYDEASRIIPQASEDGLSFSAELEAPGIYHLIETKAPEGYSLLLHPIRFRLYYDDAGRPAIELDDTGGTLISGEQVENDETQLYLKVADIKTGNLPYTGGSGLAPWAVAAMALIGAGFLSMRRRI